MDINGQNLQDINITYAYRSDLAGLSLAPSFVELLSNRKNPNIPSPFSLFTARRREMPNTI